MREMRLRRLEGICSADLSWRSGCSDPCSWSTWDRVSIASPQAGRHQRWISGTPAKAGRCPDPWCPARRPCLCLYSRPTMGGGSCFIRSVSILPERVESFDAYPFSIPAVCALREHDLHLAPGVTFLVGENG